MLVLFIYITRLASNEIFSPSNKILMATLILLPALLYLIPTVTNNKELNVHNTKYSSECVLHFYTSLFHIVSSFETILPVLNEFHACQSRTLHAVLELFSLSSLNLFITCELNSFDMFREICKQPEVTRCQIWAIGRAWNNLKFNVL